MEIQNTNINYNKLNWEYRTDIINQEWSLAPHFYLNIQGRHKTL